MPVCGAIVLMTGEYRVQRCFSRPGGLTGCGSEVVPLSPAALPALVGPLLVIAVLCGLAVVGARARDTAVILMAAALAALLGGAPLLGVGWPLMAPLLLLVSGASLVAGMAPRAVAIDLAAAASLVAAAFAAGYAVLIAMAEAGVGTPAGPSEVWLLLAFAALLGVSLGLLDAPRARRRPLVRGLACAYLATAGAVVIAALLLRPVLYPAGTYVNVGIGALYLTLLALLAGGLIAGTVSARLVLGLPWRSALVAAGAGVFAFPIVAAAALLFASLAPAGPGFAPPLPLTTR